MANIETPNTQTKKQPMDPRGFSQLGEVQFARPMTQFEPTKPLPDMPPEEKPITPQENLHKRQQKAEQEREEERRNKRKPLVKKMVALGLATTAIAATGLLAHIIMNDKPASATAEGTADLVNKKTAEELTTSKLSITEDTPMFSDSTIKTGEENNKIGTMKAQEFKVNGKIYRVKDDVNGDSYGFVSQDASEDTAMEKDLGRDGSEMTWIHDQIDENGNHTVQPQE